MEHREIICKLATFCIKIMDLHIVVLEVMSMQTDAIWQILPESIKEALKKGGISLDSFEEIRIRTQRPVSVRRKMNLFYLNQNGSLTKTLLPEMSLVIMSKAEMEQILLNAKPFFCICSRRADSSGLFDYSGKDTALEFVER